MGSSSDLDRTLWFEPGCCADGPHFLTHNPHTFPGRMGAWCEAHDRSFAVSKSEIERCSHEAAYWVSGFQAGSEPPHPLDLDGYDIDDPDDLRWRAWHEAIAEFRRRGVWPRGAPTGRTEPIDPRT